MKTIAVAVVVLIVLGGLGYFAAQHTQTVAASNEPSNPPLPNPETPAAPQPVASAVPATPAVAEPAAAAEPAAVAAESVAQAAMKKSAEGNKHLFVFVSESDNEETAAAKRVLEAAMSKLGDTAEAAFINRNSAAEKDFVEKHQLGRAPMPIVLAMAPNGAITGAYFGEKLKDPKLQESIVSGSEQQVLKALQDGKLVFLCAQNATTKSNEAAMKGVNEFKADTRFAQFTEVVTIDPAVAAEQPFLAKLKLDPKATEATTAFLAPPGSVVAKVNGATTKDALLASLQAASSGGCGGAAGCGPKGCAPVR
jgi:hypothetical protein